MNRLVEWSPCDCSQFVSSTLNRLELHRIIENYSELQIANSLKITRTIVNQAVFEFNGTINCLNWHPNDNHINENAIVVGLSDGSISLVKSDSKSDTFNSIVSVYDQSSGKKPCTALSFNKINKNLLAAGFEKKSGGKGDFCFAVFDIEHKNNDSIENYKLFRPGGIGLLNLVIRLTRFFYPSKKTVQNKNLEYVTCSE